MKQRSKWTLLLVCFLASCGGNSGDSNDANMAAVEAGLLPPVVQAGEPLPMMLLEERMDYYHVPGISITVINDGKIEWSRGYGVVVEGGPQAVERDTLFQVASISKTIAATAIMLLQQEGLLDIEQEANRYLSSWMIPHNEYTAQTPVTIRHLLSHTGGLNVDGFDGYNREGPIPSLLQTLDGLPPANHAPVRVMQVPGTQFSYSGGGMEILRQLTEDVTGQSYPVYVNLALFSPLAMASSNYLQPAESAAASGHDTHGNVVAGKWNIYPEFAAAGLWSTSEDLAHFALAVQKAAGGQQGTILLPETVASMLTPQATVSGDKKQGLGFQLQGGMFLHNGANNGYRARLVAYRDRSQGAVILTNGDNGTYLIDEICRSIAHVYGWPDYNTEERLLVTVPVDVLSSYAGRYRLDGGTAYYNLRQNANELMIQIEAESSIWFPLYAVSSDTFLVRISESIGEIKFVPGGFEFSTQPGVVGMTASKVSD